MLLYNNKLFYISLFRRSEQGFTDPDVSFPDLAFPDLGLSDLSHHADVASDLGNAGELLGADQDFHAATNIQVSWSRKNLINRALSYGPFNRSTEATPASRSTCRPTT